MPVREIWIGAARGDVWTLTVQEYLESSRWKRFAYRLARNPIVLFVIAPLSLFLVQHRFPIAWRRQARTALGVLDEPGAVGRGRGHERGLRVEGVSGDSVVDRGHGRLGGRVAVLRAASIRRRVLGTRARTGITPRRRCRAVRSTNCRRCCNGSPATSGSITSIILSPRIPNYNLERCHKAEPLFQTVPPVTLFSSFKSFTFRLWDEQRRKLVGYGHLRTLRRQRRQAAH